MKTHLFGFLHNRRTTFWLASFVLLLSLFTFSSQIAVAQVQSAENINLDSLQAAALSEDEDTSRAILSGLLSSFGETPLTAFDTPDSLLGQIFFVFNVALFVIGVAFMAYTIIMSIAVSAHEGEVMGRRMSSLWVPIRYGMGVFGMIPAFGGFSLAQAVMMFFAILGIGLANLMTTTAIDATGNFDALIRPPALVGVSVNPSITYELGKEVFAIHVCSEAVGSYKRWYGGTSPTSVQVDKTGLSVKGLTFKCGAIDIVDETGIFSNTIRSDGSNLGDYTSTPFSALKGALGFRNNAVDYSLISEIAKSGAAKKQEVLQSLSDSLKVEAQLWFKAMQETGKAEFPLEKINSETDKYRKVHDDYIQTQLAKYDPDTIKANVKNFMKSNGWTGLGSWFSLFSEINAALQSAAMASRFEIIPPDLDGFNIDEGTKNLLVSLFSQRQVAEDKGTCFGVFDENATGNCSPAQNMFLWTLGMIIQDTGGEGMVNPIIAAKNIGDWMLTFVGTVAGTAILVDFFESGEKKSSLTKGKFFGSGSNKTNAAKDGDGSMGSKMATLILTMSVILGLTFAVYIPFVPFLTWFSALVSYFASVLEGLVAAQVWAFSHLHTDGEGMGQKAERGYLFILNMLLRPALMVLGFFFASGILTLLGTFFFNQFGTALANVQGNTMTGPFVMMGLLIVVGLALLTLIQTVFNLIYEIPDRVISWFGGGMEARMAKEMDSGIERGAKTAAQWTGGTAVGTAIAGASNRK